MTTTTSRRIAKSFVSAAQQEGVGATVRRSIGHPLLRRLDPFLMLDEFHVALPGGFPDHSHRGFETITYLLPHSPWKMLHEDFCGHKGELAPGVLQWMCPGRDIEHAEMPASCDAPAIGLQLWLNLPAHKKMIDPKYQEIPAAKFAKAMGEQANVFTNVPISYVHFTLTGSSTHFHPIPTDHNSFVYVISGSGRIGGDSVEAHSVILLTADEGQHGITLETNGEELQCVVLSGEPIREPIEQYGPFVMTTRAELQQTVQDFQLGHNGFEQAKAWRSQIAQLAHMRWQSHVNSISFAL
ncbi:hypothetical protein H310_06633 [Aphanomyces invadans]|uniref:Pirin N-terminal domain-containing protein n=1 Tax=Aphanomyces invadans TaxID=157072 RepID=A0A024U432_9STRA|nr:hypothetical protein H310_06633 [Aphanomyces invadans]ETW00994.1 hypothetical protein H310_06633 [Aphanomyces invadans]|eukprot:XP_008869992.1 hypothetical protein H310_06633 [Aphanomyces invadans]